MIFVSEYDTWLYWGLWILAIIFFVKLRTEMDNKRWGHKEKAPSTLSYIKNYIEGKDPFYDVIETEQIDLYQYFFNKTIESVNVDNYTGWTKGKGNYDESQLAKDDKIMEQIILNEGVLAGLHPATLQVIVHQYFFADVYQREMDKNQWVKRVLFRKDIDFFPDGASTHRLMN